MNKKRVLISVFDKAGSEKLASFLQDIGWEIISSSGTARYLQEAGIEVTEISDLTGFPHMLGGRVKTLHPAVFGGILARRNLQEDLDDVDRFEIPLIDMVVCNLYPFEKTARRGSSLEDLIENIDIGGVTLIRAAAKNYQQVVILTDPEDYPNVMQEIETEGNVTTTTRQNLALKAFSLTSEYDSMIHSGISDAMGIRQEGMIDRIPLNLRMKLPLRYGENPHQEAGLYLPPLSDLPWDQLSGKPLSYNNILDLDCAMRGTALMQDRTAALVIKHTTPCGMAYGKTARDAYERAFGCDPLSAFGGIVGITREIDLDAANAIAGNFTEVLLAPDYSQEALELLKEKKPSLRILRWKGGRITPLHFTGTWSGVLVQEDKTPPLPDPEKGEWIGKPREDLWEDLILAWKTACISKSNAVALVKNGKAVGIGMGFCSRLFAVNFAVDQAGEQASGSVMASDAFFPFPDGVEAAAKAGVSVIIQPGGSVRDDQVFKRAEELGISMFISHFRTFRH